MLPYARIALRPAPPGYVLADATADRATADRAPAVHDFLTARIFPTQAHVITIPDLDTLLSAAPSA